MLKLSRNKKLNSVLNVIYEDLQEVGLETIQHYKNEFKNVSDYNIAQYGNMLVWLSDIRKMYRDCGYKSMEKWSDKKIWDTYKRQVGYIARMHFR